MVNVPTILNDLKTKVIGLDVSKLKTVPVDLKKINDVVSKEVVKKSVYNTRNTKLNNLEKKIPDTSNLIQRNQYNTDKQIWKKNGDAENKIREISGLASTAALNPNSR